MNLLKVKDEILSQYDDEKVVSYLVSNNDKFEFILKWDGCSDITIHHNDSTVSNPTKHFEDCNWKSFHVCELREFVDMLEEAYSYAIDNGYEY